jgi:hypothetical protein
MAVFLGQQNNKTKKRKHPSIKQQIRGVERLLKREGLAPGKNHKMCCVNMNFLLVCLRIGTFRKHESRLEELLDSFFHEREIAHQLIEASFREEYA